MNKSYQDCVTAFLKRNSRYLAQELDNDVIRKITAVQHQCTTAQKIGGRNKYRIERRSSVVVPDRRWIEHYENVFSECLGILETFRPAARNLPEFRAFSLHVSQLHAILSFAQSMKSAN